jgi:sensitive to high expression protein 9
MSLIRSEHLNDQAIRLAKESVIDAESALEEARTQLEKRERAQYHEEQIWSDTIRRNSTWVTFGLMGVNIFLLLLSLAILEPWRRRRMVREIKSALAANNKVAAEAGSMAAGATVVAASTNEQDIALIEEEIDRVTDDDEGVVEVEPVTPAVVQPVVQPVVEEVPIAVIQATTPEATAAELLEPVAEPIPETEIPLSLPYRPAQEYKDAHFLYSKSDPWQEKVSAIAQDIVSERVISMRRVDYTTAILQGAAVGAVIMAAIMGMLGSN